MNEYQKDMIEIAYGLEEAARDKDWTIDLDHALAVMVAAAQALRKAAAK